MVRKIDPTKYRKAKAAEVPSGKKAVSKFIDNLVDKGPRINPIPTPKTQRNLYPNGSISEDDVNYLKSKNDPKLNSMVDRNIGKKGNTHQYGANESDAIRQVLSKRKK